MATRSRTHPRRQSLPRSFGEFLFAERRAHGDSRESLAVALGVSYKTIRNWEKDVYPPKLDEFVLLVQRYEWDWDVVTRIERKVKTLVA
jgi:transcriptional regulator with XRE-family HTH domain